MRGFTRTTACSLAVWLLVAGPAFAQAPPNEPPKIWTVTASAGLALTQRQLGHDQHQRRLRHRLRPAAPEYRQVGRTLPPRKNRGRIHLEPDRVQHPRPVQAHAAALRIRSEPVPEGRVQGHRLPARAHRRPWIQVVRYADDQARRGRQRRWRVGEEPGSDVRSSGALGASEKLVQTLTSNTTLTQTFGGLWKMNDFEDAALHVRGERCGVDVHAYPAQGRSPRHVQEQAAAGRPAERRRRADGYRLQE